jgi:alcohol dehydrogenase class IV
VSVPSFEVLAPRRIVFGVGASRALPEHVRALAGAGAPVLLVTGRDPTRHAHLVSALAAAHPLEQFTIAREPHVEDAERAVARARAANVAVVVALGGGSALDLGKAISALAPNPGAPLDYLEVVGRGAPLRAPPLPFVAVPTTAGSGAEATKNAVLSALGPDARPVKVSLRDDRMLPALALVDPALTLPVPPAVTAATGLDALTQVIEPYVSHAATPFTDALCREAIPRGARALRRACSDGADLDARSELSLVSLHGGLALANAKLGAVHGFAGPLGGLLGAPHGALCARLLPFVMEANLRALRARAPGSPALARYADVARWVTGSPDATPDDGARWAHDLVRALSIPTLSAAGLREADLPAVAAQSARSSSMKGNPVVLTDPELHEILARAL